VSNTILNVCPFFQDITPSSMYILRSLSGSFSIRPLRLNLLEKDSNLDQIANFEAPAPAKPMSNLFVVEI